MSAGLGVRVGGGGVQRGDLFRATALAGCAKFAGPKGLQRLAGVTLSTPTKCTSFLLFFAFLSNVLSHVFHSLPILLFLCWCAFILPLLTYVVRRHFNYLNLLDTSLAASTCIAEDKTTIICDHP